MNILQLSDNLSLGGTEKTLQIITKYLTRQPGVNAFVGAITAGGNRLDLIKADTGIEARVFHGQLEALKQYIVDNGIDIIHLHRSNDAVLPAIKLITKLGIPLVETNAFGKISGDPAEWQVTHRLFVSNFCAMRFRRKYHLNISDFISNNGVFYNPIDPEEFSPVSDAGLLEYKRAHGLTDKFVMGRIGRADDLKFGDMCLRMLPKVIQHNPNVRLVLFSATRRVQRLIERLRVTSYVTILPESSIPREVSLFYKSIDLLTHASLIGESFGCTLAEAMFDCKPIVVNSTPYFDNAQIELVTNGQNGLVVDNPRSYAEAVIYFLDHPEARISFGLRGHSQAEQKYAINRTIGQLMTLYQAIIHKTSVPTSYQEYDQEYAQRLQNIYHSKRLARIFASSRNVLQYKYLIAKTKFSRE